ncbi:MAG: DNA repair protein RecO [Candidatus Omnitrophica bacterium]|nr:DNA repair protein RecO [Candidatus Omnitrophota bacterium]
MAIQKTEAFVLKTQPFRSSSLIITFFSKSFGKLRGIAKGVRREREVRGAVYELFTHLEIVFYEKIRSDLHLVSEAAIVESHDRLRTDLQTIAYASYFSELVDMVTEVHDSHPQIFELLDFAFKFLPSLPPASLAKIFEVKLLNEIGWLPYLENCLACKDSKFESGFFSIRQGAIFCPNCISQAPEARPLSREGLNALRFYTAHNLEQSIKLRMGEKTEIELERLLEQFLTYRLPRPLHSRAFMQKIRPVLASR